MVAWIASGVRTSADAGWIEGCIRISGSLDLYQPHHLNSYQPAAALSSALGAA